VGHGISLASACGGSAGTVAGAAVSVLISSVMGLSHP
jgi:hypothetical protein